MLVSSLADLEVAGYTRESLAISLPFEGFGLALWFWRLSLCSVI